MSTVKELKNYIRNNKPSGCRPYSKLKRNELLKLAKELGHTEPERKARVKKAPEKKAVVKKPVVKKAPEKKAVEKKAVDKSKFKTKDEVIMTTDPMDLKQFIGKMMTLTENFEKEYKKVIDKLLKPIQGKKTDDHKEKVKKARDEYNNNFVEKEHPLVKKAKDEIKKINTLDFSNEQLFTPIIKAENKQFNRVKRAVRR